MTYTYLAIMKLLSKASKRNLLYDDQELEGQSEQVKGAPGQEEKSPFHKLMLSLNALNLDINFFHKDILDRLHTSIEEIHSESDQRVSKNSKKPESECPKIETAFVAKVDDIIRDYNEIGHKPHDWYKRDVYHRNLDSIVRILKGFSDPNEEGKKNPNATNFLNSDVKVTPKGDKIYTLNHINGKIKYKGPMDQQGNFDGVGSLFHYNGTLMYRGQFFHGKINSENCQIFSFSTN